ncbi:MAG: dTMP kinase [Armatimonadetes bacterium CG_4_10_14_3_um_filter_66_18]|nr:MAG: dTMP kinase [Armatimonadetes bacterium CG_4_8_14_3_um_filter_66_20]PIY48561.1 MAG: dTMP kinase [Armatimonadetes bacterium CG_4_10_14_3_um_filter_66_18]
MERLHQARQEEHRVSEDTNGRWSGFFLTLEGPEGCGKSTQAELLAEHFRRSGLLTVVTREPGGTVLGDKLRALLLDPAHGEMTPRTELLLYEAARAQHVEQVIRPALERGALVVCDRFMDSSSVYQGNGLGLYGESVALLNRFAVADVTPDLTIVLDLPAADGLRRANATGSPDRIEQRPAAFHERVRKGFLALARAEPARVVVVSATDRREQVCCDIIRMVTDRWRQ